MLQPNAFVCPPAAIHLWRISPALTAAAALLSSLGGCGSSRSTTTQPPTVQEAPAADDSPQSAASCSKQGESGFESVEVAFRRYAEAINQGNWCEAAGTFGAAARIDLAETNFKALTLLAGAANPNRELYQAELKRFCGDHGLECRDAQWLEQAVADMMTGTDVAPKLAELRRSAADNPAQIYRELMLHMSAVDAGVLTKIDPALADVEITDGKASGAAKRQDGRVSRVNFTKAATGWQMSIR